MTSRPVRYHRKRLRLANYDYSTPGIYLVTICVHHMEHRFGEVHEGQVELNDAGLLVENLWSDISNRHVGVNLDEWIVMPNHLHGIIVPGTVPDAVVPPLSRIVGEFKSCTTVHYARGVCAGSFPRFDRSLWQRGFHDRIIRNETSLAKAREYIAANPVRWIERGGRR